MLPEQISDPDQPAAAHHPVRDFLHWDAFRDRVSHTWHSMRDRRRGAPPPPSPPPGAAPSEAPPREALEPMSNPPFMPAIDSSATAAAFIFTADVPGLTAQDIEISVSDNRLMIGGRRAPDPVGEGEQALLTERPYGPFRRWYILPYGVDGLDVQSWVEAGVLTVVVPRPDPSQPKRIAVSSS
jgi:HSP20 family protein